MPRIVDHEARRLELTAAVWAIIRDEGTQAVTIRAVADRSGWSSGAVRHYLPTREAIMTFAAQQVAERSRAYLEAIPLTGELRDDFRRVALATLPLDHEMRLMLEIWLAFVGDAVSGAESAQHALLYDDLHAFLGEALGAFAEAGWLPADAVPVAAIELHGLLDGLAVHMLLRQASNEDAERAFDRWLDRTLVAP